MREQFENLPVIAEIIKEGVFWDGEIYRRTAICKLTHLYYVRGAWYAFQEQQKKIDEVLNLVCKLQYSSGERIYSEVKELLK